MRSRRHALRTSTLAATLAALASLTACGGAEAAPTPGVSGDTITIGAILPLSDAVAVIGKPIASALRTYADAVNARGGIGGRYRLKVLVEDQTYANPSTSAQKYQKVKGDVAMFAAVVGTDHINSLLPLLDEDSLMVGPMTFDSEWAREPNLLPWGAPYQIWAMNGVAYYLSLPGNAGKRVCGMALATGYGEAGLEGLRWGAERGGYEVQATASFKQDDQDFVAPITQLRNARCDVVLLVSLPGSTGRVLGAAAQARFAPQWILLSPGWLGAFVESPLRDYLIKTTWVRFDAAEWGDTSVTAMPGLLDAMQRFSPEQKPDIYFAAGWVSAIAADRLLTKAVELGDLSRAGLMRASEALGTVEFGGMSSPYGYGPAADRRPPRTTTIFRVDPANPIGLSAVARNYGTPAADAYEFRKKPR